MKTLAAGAAMILMLLIAAMPLRALAAPALSAATLYNQGNAYARAGKPGMAVLNYERAQLLDPGDADLEANLNAVRMAQHVSVAPKSWLTRLAMLPDPSVAALVGMLGLVLLGFGAVLAPRITPSRALSLAAAGLGLVLMGLTVVQAALLRPALHAGVVIAREAPVRVSPVPMGETLFLLPEAETVTLAGAHDDFLLVKTNAGRMGWVLGTNLAQVIPSALR